jgi:integrase
MGTLSNGLVIPGVYEKDGRYYKVIKNKWFSLSRIDQGPATLYRAMAQLEPTSPQSLGDIMKLYAASGMDELRPATQADYLKIIGRLLQHFGHVVAGELKPRDIAMWLEERRKAGRGRTRANREFAVLSSIHKFAMRHGWVDSNPCHGVPRNKEKPRRRYVTDAEFSAAFDRSPEAFQDLIAGAYLSGARQTDVVGWTRENITPDGIAYQQSKTGKPHTVSWSPALKFFVERALNRCPDAQRIFLNQHGEP